MIKKPAPHKEFRSMLEASSIGLVFVISIVIGALIGVWLDGKFGTKPYLTIFFLLLGVASGVKNAWFFIKKSMNMEDEDDNTGNKE